MIYRLSIEVDTAMRGMTRSIKDPWFIAVIGVLIVIISAAGLKSSLQAGIAQAYYRQAKYGMPRAGMERVLELSHKAYGLYPHNYYFSILAAEMAHQASGSVQASDKRRLMDQSIIWCDRGLVQNWWNGSLRRLKARHLWQESPVQAIMFWKAYTEWQCWEPYNHSTLAEMYAGVGDFEKAEQSLRLASGTPEGEEARLIVEKEREEWAQIYSEGN